MITLNDAAAATTADGTVRETVTQASDVGRQALAEMQRLLGVLRDRRPTMNEVGVLLGLDKSSVSGLVGRAERRGLVARAPSRTDRRAVLVELTRDGRALVAEVAARFAHDIAALLDDLGESDRAALSRTVSRLVVAHAAAQGIDLFATGSGS